MQSVSTVCNGFQCWGYFSYETLLKHEQIKSKGIKKIDKASLLLKADPNFMFSITSSYFRIELCNFYSVQPSPLRFLSNEAIAP